MTVATRPHRSRVDEGWIRCPKCRRLFKHSHRCDGSLGEPVTRRPDDFDAQVERARAEARADALAGEQLTLDAVVDPCEACGRTGLPLDKRSRTCTTCMADAARAEAGLPPRAGPP